MFIMNAGVRHPEYCFLIQMSKNRTEGDFRHLPAQCTTLAHQRNYIRGGKERLDLPTPVLWITCDEKHPYYWAYSASRVTTAEYSSPHGESMREGLMFRRAENGCMSPI